MKITLKLTAELNSDEEQALVQDLLAKAPENAASAEVKVQYLD